MRSGFLCLPEVRADLKFQCGDSFSMLHGKASEPNSQGFWRIFGDIDDWSKAKLIWLNSRNSTEPERQRKQNFEISKMPNRDADASLCETGSLQQTPISTRKKVQIYDRTTPILVAGFSSTTICRLGSIQNSARLRYYG